MLTNAQIRNMFLAALFKRSDKYSAKLTDAYYDLISSIQLFATRSCPTHYNTDFYGPEDLERIIYEGIFENKSMPETVRYFIAWYVGGRDNIDSQSVVFDDKQAGMTAAEFKSLLKMSLDKQTKVIADFNIKMSDIANIVAQQPIGENEIKAISDMRRWCDIHRYEQSLTDITLFMYGYIEGIRHERAKHRIKDNVKQTLMQNGNMN